ncbi:autophagy-related protein 27-domain-containing protein [Cerioporus squamosus]|nr:autophagy-related protein 27-domain-containing protein [Cerioporus squamosus]
MFLLAALALLVLPVHFIWAADPTRGVRTRWLKNLVEQCAFSIGDVNFDLCPVLDGNDGGWKVEFERRTPPTVTKTSYRIDLRAPLKRDDALPGHEQCPDGTWICQTVSNRRPRHEDEEARVLQVVPVAGAMHLPNVTGYRPGVNITAQFVAPRNNPDKPALHIRLHGGYYVYGAQKADFQFVCDRSVDEPTAPTYIWTWNGTHTFQWRTRHACGSMRAKPQPPTDRPEPSQDSDEDETLPPPDDESPDDGEPEELVDGDPFSRRTARSMMVLLLSSCTAVVTLAYLAWHPPARVRQYVTRFVKAHPRLGRWRVGERVLLRWAYEDFEMGEDFGEGEEDTMVNFASEEETGEGIPLKPSPRKGRWPSYGTA